MLRTDRRIPSWRPGRLAKTGSGLLAWMLLRAVAQAATIILLARQLGADAYGLMVAVLAIGTFLAPLAGAGLPQVLLRNTARDPTNGAAYLAIAMRWWEYSWPASTLLGFVLAWALLPKALPPALIFAVITIEIAVLSLSELASKHSQSRQMMQAYGAIHAGLPIARFVTIGALVLLLDRTSTQGMLLAYAGSGLLYVLIMLYLIRRQMPDSASNPPESMTIRDGTPFILAATATRLQAEFNKPVLARLDPALAGNFNVAQRVVDLAYLPLAAFQEALWPRLYGQSDPRQQWRRTGSVLLAMALILGVSLTAAAPLLSLLLGTSFSEAILALRLLAWLPFFLTLRNLANFHAIHHGRMGLIGWAHTVGACLSVSLVTLTVPRWGLMGAVAAAYLSELAMILVLAVSCLRKHRHASKGS